MNMVVVTVFAHAADVEDARALAGYLNDEPASLSSFKPRWQDAAGEIIHVASGPKSAAWRERATQPLGDRPAWDTGYSVNMTGAGRALDKLVIWSPADGGTPPAPAPGRIVAVVGPDGVDALAMLGLRQIEIGDV
jgi:hypothetical protein